MKKCSNQKAKIITVTTLICILSLTACGNHDQAESFINESESETNFSTGQSSGEDVPWEGYILHFTDWNSMDEKFRADWQEQLGETVYSYSGSQSDSQEYIDASENSEEELEFPFYFYSLDEFSIPTFHKTTAYGYIADADIYIMRRTQESFEEITDAVQAEELAEVMSEMFFSVLCLADYEEEDGNLATIISGLGEACEAMFDGMVDLSSPEAAVTELLHYSGGTAESIPRYIYGNGRIVTYTFADGSKISWYMTQEYECRAGNGLGALWFPVGSCGKKTVTEARKIREYMTYVSVEHLRETTQEVDYGTDEWMTLPEDDEEDIFVLVYEDAEEDIALYGLYGGLGIVLRDGNDTYPIYAEWAQMTLPFIKKADYDNDGTEEYALWQIVGRGTGYMQQELFMLEPDSEQETGLRVHEFTTTDMKYQFDAAIDYSLDEETNMLRVETNAQSVEMDLTEYLETEEEYEGLGWGDIIHVEEMDGQWYLTMSAGILFSSYAQPQYECGITFSAPITYIENGCFQTGAITVEKSI